MTEYRRFSETQIKDWQKFLDIAKDQFPKRYKAKGPEDVKKSHFDILKPLGEGAFGRVFLAKYTKSGKIYALKSLDKQKLVKKKETKSAVNEKKILQALNFPFCVYLAMSFQDNSYLYLCLPFICGGEMFEHLKKKNRFEENLTRFYGAQVLLAFEYLHHCNLLFRDLKPENILIDQKGYLKVTDFGFCKMVPQRTYTFCGTPEYIAPEIIMNKGYGRSVDFWSFGVLLFEMASGDAPFHAKKIMKIYENISNGRYSMPRYFSYELADLIENILQVDLTRRFGVLKNGINDIKDHPWFRNTEWMRLLNRDLKPPFVPSVKGPQDTSNFGAIKIKKLAVRSKNVYHKDFVGF